MRVICCWFCLLMIFSGDAFPQKVVSPGPDRISDRIAESSFKKISIGSENQEEKVIEYLESTIQNLQGTQTGIRLLHRIESPAGVHYTFIQTHNDIPVYGSQLKANMDKKGNLIALFNLTFATASVQETGFPDSSLAKTYIIQNKIIPENMTWENTWFHDGERLIPGLRIEILGENDVFVEVLLDADGKVLLRNDLSMYSNDTTATTKIFLPDPLSTAEVTYGSPYVDSNDADIPVLNAERVDTIISVIYDTTTNLFLLENDYAKITEMSSPNVPAATSGNPDFSFTRAEPGFEDVNALYHVTDFQLYIQSLGFDLVRYQIFIDTHAHNGQDQSSFISGSNPPRLLFGEGGVDDAEDADVIIHEYGHAIMYSAAPNTNTGTERQTLDEGIGDYLAASYSKYLTPFMWENVFSWDGHNEFWPGRKAVTDDFYPEDRLQNIYADADMWSAPLMKIEAEIGRNTAHQILFQSAFSYSAGMTMSDGAELFLQADSLLFGGEHSNTICTIFNKRGLLFKCENRAEVDTDTVVVELEQEIKIKDGSLENFAVNKGPAIVTFKIPETFSAELFDIRGRLLQRERLENRIQYLVQPEFYRAGMYFLRIQTDENTYIFKLLKIR